MSITGDLEVIVPKGFDRKRIPEILRSKQRWIERVVERMSVQQQLAGMDVAATHPTQISLQAIAETWQVSYEPTSKSTLSLIEKPRHHLILRGHTQQMDYCKAALQQWVMQKAQGVLLPWLESVSQEVKLSYQSAAIRQQKTIWGSCSIRKTISLNAKLLFLPEAIVRYVLVHELCHTVHLNHSPDFWSLVGQHEPAYKDLDASLRDARYLVPGWMEQ